MKRLAYGMTLLLCGCAMSGVVQRFGAEYNAALAGMSNQLVLLNVIRAREGLPLHYTSISKFTGTVNSKANASLGAQVKEPAPTSTNSSTSTVAPTGVTAVTASTLSVVRGGNVISPTIGGEINSGSGFEVAIFDTQTFYQGILAEVPFTTIDNFIEQGFDNHLLMSLLVKEFELTLAKENEAAPNYKVGDHLQTIRSPFLNGGEGEDPLFKAANDDAFAQIVDCYRLQGESVTAGTTKLVPLSRLTHGEDGKTFRLRVEDFTFIDGEKLGISGEITPDPNDDKQVFLTRRGHDKRAPKLVLTAACPGRFDEENGKAYPKMPPPVPVYLNAGKVMVLGANDRAIEVDAKISVIFRSTEGVIRFLGECMRATVENEISRCRIGSRTIFAVRRGSGREELSSTDLLGEHYYIPRDTDAQNSMAVIALIEQLINLHKSSADKPTTIAVQVLP
jgi:hypothetical protein